MFSTEQSHFLHLESVRWPNTPDAAARALCAVVERLSTRGLRLWRNAKRRVFDVGYDLPPGSRSVHVALQPDTLERIVALGATVAFSCYREDSSEPSAAPNAGSTDAPSVS